MENLEVLKTCNTCENDYMEKKDLESHTIQDTFSFCCCDLYYKNILKQKWMLNYILYYIDIEVDI